MANNEYKPVTAADKIAPFSELETDADNRKKAEDAGVVSAAYIDYEKALENYESRPDVETLEQRLARESGKSFAEGAVIREADPQTNHLVASEELQERKSGLEEAEAFARRQANETGKVSEGKEVDASDLKEAQDEKNDK